MVSELDAICAPISDPIPSSNILFPFYDVRNNSGIIYQLSLTTRDKMGCFTALQYVLRPLIISLKEESDRPGKV